MRVSNLQLSRETLLTPSDPHSSASAEDIGAGAKAGASRLDPVVYSDAAKKYYEALHVRLRRSLDAGRAPKGHPPGGTGLAEPLRTRPIR